MKGIAVILPVYNGADMLDSCLRSIFLAGERVSEIIIVDDGSTDKTLSKAETLAENNPKISVIHTENHGSYMARVTGIKASTARYIAFIDVDDHYYNGSLDLLAELLEEHDADIAFGGIVETTEAVDAQLSGYTGDAQIKVSSSEQMWPRIMKWKTQEFLLYIWHKLYKKELFDGLPEIDGICQGDDVILTCRAFMGAKKIVETTAPVYMYYTNPLGLTHKGFSDSDLDLIHVWDAVIDLVKSTDCDFNMDPSLQYLARYNRWRTDFTLIMRLILTDDKDKDRNYAAELKKWRIGLKDNWKNLITPHAMPKSREILIIALRFFYSPTKALLRLVKRLQRANIGELLHSGEKR